MSRQEIAMALGICDKTLEKHFESELQHGRARKRAEAVGLLYASARKGNVSAQKKLVEITGTAAAAAEWEAAEGIGKPPPNRKLGKKEEQAIAAQTAGQGTEWGDDLVPGGPTH
jgi:predicted transcriptional regulator